MTGPRPLSGTIVLNTRPAEQAGEFSEMLQQAGAAVRELPLLVISSSFDHAALKDKLAALQPNDWVVFTSANGVRAALPFLTNLAGRIAVIGEKSAVPLNEAGITPALVGVQSYSEGFTAELLSRLRREPSGRVLLLRGDSASALIPKGLVAGGVEIDTFTVYQSTERKIAAEELQSCFAPLLQGETAPESWVLALTSPKATRHLMALAETMPPLAAMLRRAPAVAVGPKTVEAAEPLGLQVHMAHEASAEAIVECIVGLKAAGRFGE